MAWKLRRRGLRNYFAHGDQMFGCSVRRPGAPLSVSLIQSCLKLQTFRLHTLTCRSAASQTSRTLFPTVPRGAKGTKRVAFCSTIPDISHASAFVTLSWPFSYCSTSEPNALSNSECKHNCSTGMRNMQFLSFSVIVNAVMIAVLHMQWRVTIGINAFTKQTESVSLWQKAYPVCVREDMM